MFKIRSPITFGTSKQLITESQFEEVVRDIYTDIIDSGDDDDMGGGVLKEQFSKADRQLALEDIDWVKLGHVDGIVMSENARRSLVKLSRIFAIRNSLVRQSVQLYTNFSVGTGMNITSDDKNVRTVLMDFMNNKANRRFTRTHGQRKLSDMFLQDGEMFLALFAAKGKVPVLRPIDSLEIKDIATDPEDKYTNRFYKRVRMRRDNKEEVVWMRDFENDPRRPGIAANNERVNTASHANLPLIYYVQLQGLDKRGYPLATAQLQWARAHKVFMNSRIAIQQALARTAKQYKLKGGIAQLNKVKAAIQSALVTGNTETNPPPTYAGSEVFNQAMEVKTARQETGARAAEIDGNMILTMAGAAVGIFPHYFGAGEAFRLATATAMETPMLKTFQAYRRIWVDIWKDILDFVLEAGGIDSSNVSYQVVYPDIFPEKLQSFMQSVDFLLKAYPEFSGLDELKKLALSRIGITDIDNLLAELDAIPKSNGNVDNVTKEANKRLLEMLKAMISNRTSVDVAGVL